MVYQMVMYIFTQKHIYPEMWHKKLVHFAHMQFTDTGLLLGNLFCPLSQNALAYRICINLYKPVFR